MKSNMNKIGRKFGRRSHDRFSVPGTTVAWSYADRESSHDETSPLSDLSEFGLAFLTNHPPEVEADVHLMVNLPKHPEQIVLHGRTIYVIPRGPGLTYEYRVGVQLRPFADNEGDNSPQVLEVIQELEQMYGKRLEEQDIED
jgi:Tfp pilus assembly protein PilZ